MKWLTLIALFGLAILSSTAGFSPREKRPPQYTWSTLSEDSSTKFTDPKYWTSTDKNNKDSQDAKQDYGDPNTYERPKLLPKDSQPSLKGQEYSKYDNSLLFYDALNRPPESRFRSDNQPSHHVEPDSLPYRRADEYPQPPHRDNSGHSPPLPPDDFGHCHPPPLPPHHGYGYPPPPPPHRRHDHPPPPPPDHGYGHPPPPPHHDYRLPPAPPPQHQHGHPPPPPFHYNQRDPSPPDDYNYRTSYDSRYEETANFKNKYNEKDSPQEDRHTRQSSGFGHLSNYDRRGPPGGRFDHRPPPDPWYGDLRRSVDEKYDNRGRPSNYRYDDREFPPDRRFDYPRLPDRRYDDQRPPYDRPPPFHHPPPRGPPDFSRNSDYRDPPPPPPPPRDPPDFSRNSDYRDPPPPPPPPRDPPDFSRNSDYRDTPPPPRERERPLPKPERRTPFQDYRPSYTSDKPNQDENEDRLILEGLSSSRLSTQRTTTVNDQIDASQKDVGSQIDIRFSADADVPSKVEMLPQNVDQNAILTHSAFTDGSISSAQPTFFSQFVQAQPVTPEA